MVLFKWGLVTIPTFDENGSHYDQKWGKRNTLTRRKSFAQRYKREI
jgi:hypothetical protein